MNNSQREELVEYYKNLLILQYNQHGGTARATIDAIIRQVLGALIAQQVAESFNIDTAVGAQLDILGKYLGIDRSTLSYPQLSDEQFKIILKFAIIKNNNFSSTKDIADSLYAFFGDKITMTDHKNMTIRYNISSEISPYIVNILIEKNLLPKPMGVKILLFKGNKYFGFYGSNLQTFNNGILYDASQPPITEKNLIVTCDEPFATILINGQETSYMQMETGTTYTWSVSKPGYKTVSGTGTMGNSDINILVHVMNVKITPDPDLIEINGEELQGLFFVSGATLTYNIYAEKSGYNNLEIDGNTSQTTTVRKNMPELTPLCFTAKEANSSIRYTHNSYFTRDIKYSRDMVNWTVLAKDTDVVLSNIGDTVYFKGSNSSMAYSGANFSYPLSFSMSGKLAANGNINSLLDNGNGATITSIPKNCFWNLFQNCAPLISAPILSASTLGENCYQQTFKGCSIERSPVLPANNLAAGCYLGMFSECLKLKKAPKLEATILSNYCYRLMFEKCPALIEAPYLPATNLPEYCYDRMFKDCEVMETIKLAYTGNFSGNNAFSQWVQGVAESGIIYYNGTDRTTGDSAIPTGWSVENFN